VDEGGKEMREERERRRKTKRKRRKRRSTFTRAITRAISIAQAKYGNK
jgi:hypothetical protein